MQKLARRWPRPTAKPRPGHAAGRGGFHGDGKQGRDRRGSSWATPLAAAMIPPADSLLKYDTPVLVSRNTEKRSPKVRTGLKGRGSRETPMRKEIPSLRIGSLEGQRLGVKGIGPGEGECESVRRSPDVG